MFRSIKNRLPSVVVTALLVTLLVAFVLIAFPNRYGSDGLLYVRLGRGALSTDPGAPSSHSVSYQESRASEVVSIAEMIDSREIAERAIDKIGVHVVNAPRNWIERIADYAQNILPAGGSATPTMTAEEYQDQLKREEAVERIRDLIKISVPKEGYTVAVSGTGSDPELVQSVVQAVMDEYKNYHVEAHSADGSLEFFDQQVNKSRDEAMAAQEALQTTKSEMGWLSAESAVEALQERKMQLEISLDVAESELAQATSQANELQRRIAGFEQWVPTEVMRGIPNNAGDDMRSQLYGLQVEESEAFAKLMPSHPRYRMLQEKMSQSKQIMSQEGMEREQTVEALNPVRQELESGAQVALAKAAGLESRRDAILKSLEKANAAILQLNQDSISLAKLKWQAEIARDNYLGHAKSLEEARVMDELDTEKMSDVSIIQNASLNLTKVGPPRLILMLAGGLIGLLIGMVQAVVRETPTGTVADHNSTSRVDSAREPAHAELAGSPRLASYQTGENFQGGEKAMAGAHTNGSHANGSNGATSSDAIRPR